MGFIDNVLGRMKFNPDEEMEDDVDDLYEDDMDEVPQRRSPLRFRRNDDIDEDDDYMDNGRGVRSNVVPVNQRPQNQNRSAQNTTMPAPSRARRGVGAAGMQVRVIKPGSFDQASQITDTLLSERTVLLNIEGLDVNTAQRIVDFASGSCYALHGNFMKISNFIIVITPKDVDITGDVNGEGGSIFGAMAAASAANNGAGQQPQGNPFGGSYTNGQYGSANQF